MTAHKSLLFEDFTLDLERLCLHGPTGQANLRRKSFEVLRYLVEHAGRVVTKEELIAAVWPDVTVGDESLTQCVSEVRRALGREGQRIIKTIARRGYLVDVPISMSGTAAVREKPRPAGHATAVTEPTLVLTLPDRPSIAVLPFANMSADPEQEYFADGIVDDILMALSRVRWLFVIARQSSFSFKGRAADVKQVGRELGVRYVVEGSVRKAGNRVRIVAQLIDAETDAHIWSDRYERELRDIFALQDEITERIVTAIAPNVRAAEIRRARAKRTDSLTAYDLYLRALFDYHALKLENVKNAELLLRKAVEVDPEYTEALGTLTDCLVMRYMNGWQESLKHWGVEACKFADRALAAGPDNSTCVAGAAFAYAGIARRHKEAIELAERAIELHPNSVFVRNRAGTVYGNGGEFDKALAQYEVALRLNPRHPRSSTFTLTGICAAHFLARRFEQSVQWGQRAVAVAPGANIARRTVAAALAHLGRIDEARAEIVELRRHQSNATLERMRLASFPHDWMYDLYIDGLRMAGLPES